MGDLGKMPVSLDVDGYAAAIKQARAEGFAAGIEKAREVVEEERTAEFSLPSGYNLALDDVLVALSRLPDHSEGEKE